MPYKIATMLYCFNQQDEVLLMERAKEPNWGLWSPCGGKLRTTSGESPWACACREAHEELGLRITCRDLHLAGIVSEYGYLGRSHWLMFLFEVKRRLTRLPADHREGRFRFFRRAVLPGLKLPQTDRDRIWPWFWQYRGGFFAAHCRCRADGTYQWKLEEAVEAKRSPKPESRQPTARIRTESAIRAAKGGTGVQPWMQLDMDRAHPLA